MTDYPIDMMGSCIAWDDQTTLPLAMSPYLRNTRYTAVGAGTRYGTKTTMQADANPITGLACLNYQGATEITYPLVFNSAGALYQESPEGSGTLIPLAPSSGSFPANTYMESSIAFGRIYMAFHNDDTRLANYVLDGPSGLVDPISLRPVGDTWIASYQYIVGEVVTPTNPNGHQYRCTTAGLGGASEPAWPLSDGSTIADGTAVLTEETPNFNTVLPYTPPLTLVRSPGAGTFPAGKDVYFILTYLDTDGGETSAAAPTPVASIINTVLNDGIHITAPGAPAHGWLSGLVSGLQPLSYSIYYAQVTHGAAAPDPSTFVRFNGTAVNVAVGALIPAFFNNFGPAPLVNTFTLAPFGNICAGVRDAVILYKNRNGYYSGASAASIIEVNITAAGFQLFMGNIPIGPANTLARAVAFNVAGGGNAGQYAFIPFTEVISGITMTSTVINDNTTTSATFNFTDSYLAELMSNPDTNVSNFTTKIKVPPAKNINYARSVRRMIYTAPVGFEPGYLVSEIDDPESVTGDDNYISPGTTNDRPIGWVELRGQQFALKTSSAHNVTASSSVPNSWAATEVWTGSGPCGTKAFDVSGAADNPVDGDSQFVFYAHESGLYRWMGGDPYPITKFLKNQWDRLNRAYKHLIEVHIDEEAREVRIAVPLDDATTPNYIFTINYIHGWGDPMIYSHYKRAWLPNPEGWKWSLDFYQHGINTILTANRDLTVQVDKRINSRQILMGGADGTVRMIVPDFYADDAAGIDWQYQTAFVKEPDLAELGFGGIKVKGRGAGTMYLTPMTEDGAYWPPIAYTIPTAENWISHRFDIQTRGEGDNFGWMITNGYDPNNPTANAGVGIEITYLDIMARRKWKSKRG